MERIFSDAMNALVPLFRAVVVLSGMAFVVEAGSSGPPTATTDNAGEIAATSADLNATVNPNGCLTSWVFEWGSQGYTSWGPNGQYGQQLPCAANNIHVGPYTISGLSPNTTYHFQVVAYDAYGNWIPGGDKQFTTLPLPPTVSTAAASFTNAFAAGLNGDVNPNGAATTAWFEWGLDNSYGSNTPAINVGNGSSSEAVPYTLTNLSPNTTYHYQLVAANSGGTNTGGDQTFTTSPPPPPVIQSVVLQDGEISFSWQSSEPIRSNTRPI